ncbi:MAG: hypothetical protein ABSG61_00590 [Gemmatimonadales bacterium]
MTIPKPEPGLPASYSELAALLDAGRSLADFGFQSTRPQVYRFVNRYRLAHAFRSIDLAGYSLPTVRAYSALFHILVTWSVVEQYMKITHMTESQVEHLLLRDQQRECLAAIRAADTGANFFNAVADRTRDRLLASKVNACVGGTCDEVLPLVKAVRHAFAHGDLAPGANSARPGVSQKLARTVCTLLLSAIDADFTLRIREATGAA